MAAPPAWRGLLHQKLHLFQVSHGEGWHKNAEHTACQCAGFMGAFFSLQPACCHALFHPSRGC